MTQHSSLAHISLLNELNSALDLLDLQQLLKILSPLGQCNMAYIIHFSNVLQKYLVDIWLRVKDNVLQLQEATMATISIKKAADFLHNKDFSLCEHSGVDDMHDATWMKRIGVPYSVYKTCLNKTRTGSSTEERNMLQDQYEKAIFLAMNMGIRMERLVRDNNFDEDKQRAIYDCMILKINHAQNIADMKHDDQLKKRATEAKKTAELMKAV